MDYLELSDFSDNELKEYFIDSDALIGLKCRIRDDKIDMILG